ncbi:MAG: hypothetical protein WCJ39_07265 [bacterium]
MVEEEIAISMVTMLRYDDERRMESKDPLIVSDEDGKIILKISLKGEVILLLDEEMPTIFLGKVHISDEGNLTL